jgi:hypothetical protein
MNRTISNGGASRLFLAEIRFRDFEICWAGPNPVGPGFCFGSEEGWLLFTDEDGAPPDHPPDKGTMSGEAINGVAGLGRWLTVTSRQDVTFWTLPEKKAEKALCAVFPHGAHDVITTADGSFVAPLGRAGVMTIKPPFDEEHPVTVSGGEKEGLNFYRIVSLRSGSGQEVLACAARGAGIGATEFRWDRESQNLSTVTFDELDVVDICAIGEAGSLAVAAIARNGALILLRDVFQDKHPLTMKFDNVTGTAYRLLSCRGHLFLLTSKAMYVLARFVDRFLAGEPVGSSTTPMLVMHMEGADANLCGDRWLLVVMPDGVRRYDVGRIHDSVPDFISRGVIQEMQPRAISPPWKRQGIQQGRQLVGATE